MLKRNHIVLGFLAICLTATLLVGVTSSAEYDPWVDGNDDGIIDIVDIVNLAIRFGEEGTPINKTELLLDLQERVEALENQSLPLGYIGPPAYDSGWQSIEQGSVNEFNHSLGTTEVFVYMIGKATSGITQAYYGAAVYSGTYRGAYWYCLDEDSIDIVRDTSDTSWVEVRVMIWKILPTP